MYSLPYNVLFAFAHDEPVEIHIQINHDPISVVPTTHDPKAPSNSIRPLHSRTPRSAIDPQTRRLIHCHFPVICFGKHPRNPLSSHLCISTYSRTEHFQNQGGQQIPQHNTGLPYLPSLAPTLPIQGRSDQVLLSTPSEHLRRRNSDLHCPFPPTSS